MLRVPALLAQSTHRFLSLAAGAAAAVAGAVCLAACLSALSGALVDASAALATAPFLRMRVRSAFAGAAAGASSSLEGPRVGAMDQRGWGEELTREKAGAARTCAGVALGGCAVPAAHGVVV